MARIRKKRGPVAAAAPLRRVPPGVGTVDVAERLGELAAALAAVGARAMPDDLLGALQYAERHQDRLPVETTLLQVRLWEHLREQTEALIDRRQVRAVDAARAAGAAWADLAEPLGVRAASSAATKAKRMRAIDLTDQAGRPLRRTPEAVDVALAHQEQEAVAVLHREAAEQRRHALVTRIATRLLAHRAELVANEEVTDWLDEAQTVLADCRTPTQVVSLATYLGAAVRHLDRHEQCTGQPPATTEQAAAAYAAAYALVPPQGGV
ncbi:hypothetical protein [Streptomyces sp. NPDC013489]|uniref:hypothetical protein n=1 Tax=Streptomyces sp. NPDC013489 TaxID=3155606 RepID=UPI0033CF715D